MADIFISYAREDFDRVKPLATALQGEGFSVWWDDHLSPGDRFEETIDLEIQAATCIVVVWTRTSVNSRWVKNEALEGMDRDALVPVLMDDVRLPVAFRQSQMANFTDWPTSVDTGQYERLVRAVNLLVHGQSSRESTFAGVAAMKQRGRRRFRRKRDYLVPALLSVVVALSLYLVFFTNRPPVFEPAGTKITVDKFIAGPGEESRFFADSISRELQHQLESVDDLEIVQLGSFWDFDALASTDQQLADEVDYILTGEVHADSSGLRVSAELRHSGADEPVWDDEFDASKDDFLDVQNRVVLAVIGELQLATRNTANTIKPATKDKIAYRDYLLGQDLLRRGEESNIEEAIRRFDSALSRDPGFSLALASVCRANLELFRMTRDPADFAAGKENCAKMLSRDKRSAEANLAFAELYQTSGELESAKLHYLETLKLDEDNPDASIGLAGILVQEGDSERARSFYTAAAKAHPTYWKVHNALGSFYFRAGMYHQAIESYLRVVELMDDNATALSNLGAARLYNGDFDGAFDAWRKANALEPTSASFSNMGTALYYGNRLDEAIDYYRASLEMDPNDHRLWGNLGDALALSGDARQDAVDAYGEAVRLAEAVVGVNADDAYTLSRLAVYYAALHQNDAALAAIEKAQKIASIDINVLYDAAIAWKLMDRLAKATEYKNKALNAGYPEVLILADPQLSEL
ncbi:MAG: tetratricopeptide repeat protein [Pseudomonadales bacterium]|nr:tetratricopeptide repeat protein [Pseudomonadales bacterium]